MKKLLFLVVICFITITSFANHITGGTIYYTFVSQSGNSYTYNVTLLLYRDHYSTGAQLDNTAAIAIFDKGTNTMVWSNNNVQRSNIINLNLNSPNPCINNPPEVWYEVGVYNFTVTLQGNPSGYIIAYQRCCRISGINNLVGSNGVGATYTAEIPGTSQLASAPQNNSAKFLGQDTIIVCANNAFCYDFGATDADKDSLAYYFCNAYTGGTSAQPAPAPPDAPPYPSVPYNFPYNAQVPLGNNVTLNSNTGMMCGVAPAPGIYVVTVCVSEFRQGVLIATQRKDLQIKVGDCSLVDASLPTSLPVCDDFTQTFSNLSPANSLVHTYYWDFGDNSSSNVATPSHTFADTGNYVIKLVVNRGELCADSATSVAHVFPGFFPNFYFQGICVNKPTQFFDSTQTKYGVVNSWKWDFGDVNTITDVSQIQNPTYSYSQLGSKNVQLIVGSSKGCIDTITKSVPIIDKPPITLLPKDTLICNGDFVQLKAAGQGTFSWSPNTNITNANTATPTVNPTTTTNYTVTLNDNGCVNTDVVSVRVVDFVTLKAQADTVICATDSVHFIVSSDALHFSWTPAGSLNDATLMNPTALPTASTTYQVTGTIGHCAATDDVAVKLVPYPTSLAGADTMICYDSPAQLHATINGSSFTWTPSSSLNSPNSLNPVAHPATTTAYILTVTDTIGCPKPKMDTVEVTVLPKINAFAGNDTAVVVGQQVQLNASGGVAYFWTPPTGLNHNNIKNPIGIYDGSFDSIRYKVLIANEAGCIDSAYVTVKVFKTKPQVFVPTAFTPNGDGLNDNVKPIAVGISRIEYFRIYNRWGQLVWDNPDTERGWDGKIGGIEQPTATFVWIVKATDFTGKAFFAKGTVTLIR